MEAKWEPKLRKDIVKITGFSDSVERIIFVSSRPITVEKQDKLHGEFRESHQVELEIYDEGWFRIRLEEEHHDLAEKHLGVKPEPTPGFHANLVKLQGLTDENQNELLRHTSPEALRAILTAQTRNDPKNASAWKGLADVCYFMRDFDEALLYTTKALRLSNDDVEKWNLTALKAAILGDKGIASGSRILLKQSKEFFLMIIFKLGRAVDYYNLANILRALGEKDVAEAHYRRCLEIEPGLAKAWSNLGSLLVELRRQKEGLECFERALQLKPNLLEALCTKANVIVMFGDDCSEALLLLERAWILEPDLELSWPYAHYWHAMALCREGRLPEALSVVEDRLERDSSCPYLGRLATDILANLWPRDPIYIEKAEKFFSLRIDSKERNYRALGEMLAIFEATNREDQAWTIIDEFIEVEELSVRSIATRVPLKISDFTEAFASVGFYRRYRDASSLGDYARVIDECGLRPHDEVPEILFFLLIPAYFRLGLVLQDSDSESESEDELRLLLGAYGLISKVFASLGGALLSPDVPKSTEEQSRLIAGSLAVGIDVPLMEFTRLLTFLCDVAGRPFPNSYRDTVIKCSASIHDIWISEFLTAVGEDWKMDF